jgi:hypothetical protein
MMVHFIPVIFNAVFLVGNVNCEKEITATVICHDRYNFGYGLLCYYFLSLLLIFKNYEEAVLLSSWYISSGFIFVIFNTVLVLEYATF